MKTLKRIHLKDVSKVLSDREMKLVVGGYGEYGGGTEYGSGTGYGGSSICQTGYEWDWWLLTCVKKKTPSPKMGACEGKSDGDPCEWVYNGSMSYGRCRCYFPSTELHCSDLN